jgi:heptosyltransferase-1
MSTGDKQDSVLTVRLGAMGDIIHALPAVASLGRVTWVVEPRWLPLLEHNPHIARLVVLDRRTLPGIRSAWSEIRREPYRLAVDFQGLIKSALVCAAARARTTLGFADPREAIAALAYSIKVRPTSTHVVDRNLELARAAGAPVAKASFPIPVGRPEGALPPGDFVLASPFAGWGSKQWPIENYAALARRLPLVVNGPPGSEAALRAIPGAHVHISGIAGLIDATRRAAFIVGVDSGPLHLAAALGKPGVALFGPTDPARNGPYGGTFHVLRSADALTSYKRGPAPDPSMRAISPDSVFDAIDRYSQHRTLLVS